MNKFHKFSFENWYFLYISYNFLHKKPLFDEFFTLSTSFVSIFNKLFLNCKHYLICFFAFVFYNNRKDWHKDWFAGAHFLQAGQFYKICRPTFGRLLYGGNYVSNSINQTMYCIFYRHRRHQHERFCWAVTRCRLYRKGLRRKPQQNYRAFTILRGGSIVWSKKQ